MYDNYKNKNISSRRNNNFDEKLSKQKYDHNFNTEFYESDKIKFWIYDPTVLFQKMDIYPIDDMTNAERLNSMTRVVIIIALIMFLLKFNLWLVFLLLALFAIIVVWFFVKGRDEIYLEYMFRKRQYLRRPKDSPQKRRIFQETVPEKTTGFNLYKNMKMKIIPKTN